MRDYKVLTPLFLSISFFLYWCFNTYMSKPFVWDEIVSLTNFVLVDLKTTVTHYPDVNNHIFFNFLNNIYCGLLGIQDLYQAMDMVPMVRIWPLLLSLLSMFYVFDTGRRFFNRHIALIALISLITCLPFLNFTMQLRGYTLSTTLFAALIYHSLSFERRPGMIHGAAVFLLCTALMYTIPSNVFFALSIAGIFVLRWFRNGRKMKYGSLKEKWVQNRYFVLLSLLAAAAILSYILYIPVLEDLMNERHLQQVKGKSFYEYNIKDLLPNVLFAMLSYKYILILPLLMGLYALYSSVKKYGWSDRRIYPVVFIFLTFILPFVISLLRGDKTPQRSLVPLSFSFSILLAVSVYSVLRDVKWSKGRPFAVVMTVLVYSFASYFYGKSQVNEVLHKAILDRDKLNTILYNFYQSEDYGLERLDPLIAAVKQTGYPIVMAEEIDRVSEGEYLHKHDLKYFSTVYCKPMPPQQNQGASYNVLFEISQGKGNKPGYNRIGFPGQMTPKSGKLVPMIYFLMQNKIVDQQNPKFYVLTYAPRWFEKALRENFPQLKAEPMSRKISYHNIYLVSMRS